MTYDFYFIILIWICYSMAEAGIYASMDARFESSRIERVFFLIMRICLLYMCYYFISLDLVFILIGVFPFFHNGMYYSARNNKNSNIYRRRWWDNDWGSRTPFTRYLGPKARTILALASVIYAITKHYIL